MLKEMSLSAVLVALLPVFLSCGTRAAADSHLCSGSCGKHNISHPFRLKDYPDGCGDLRYNLSCENNQLILYWGRGKYRVQSINHDNFTIRLVDDNIRPYNYSFLPRYSLAPYNFSSLEAYQTYQIRQYSSDLIITKLMIYLSCENPVDSSSYVDIAPCMSGSYASAFSPSHQNRSFYLSVGSNALSDLGLGDSCRIDLMYMTSIPAQNIHSNMSCRDIHDILLYGLELSWLQSVCGNHTSRFFYSPYVDEYEKRYAIRHHHAYLDDHNNPQCNQSGSPYILQAILWTLEVILRFAVILIVMNSAAKFVLGTPFVIVFLIYKWRRRHLSMYDSIEDFLRSDNNIIPIRYSYKDIKRMTKSFKTKLGSGGYGSVFRGQLRSGRHVAVKMLDKPKANGQEFINEVATIGRIHHVNVVQLIGFCVEGSKRALIYEFMENGSLEKHIYSRDQESSSLSFEKLYAISLGIARGIEYLHNGCDMQILHFDIKPHNILLDENFNPKISDFGLAKLYPTDNSIVSLTAVRGTIGYMAPELFYRNVGGISYKADVYSFGMLLMEIASRRKNLNALAEHSSQIYFPYWVYDQLIDGREIEISHTTDEEKELAKKMIIVALWCIQTKPGDRPSMNRVVEMIEGEVAELQMPHKPSLYNVMDEAREQTCRTTPSSDLSDSVDQDDLSV